MAKISERVDGYVESKKKTWGPQLGGWVTNFFGEALHKGLETMEPGAINVLEPALKRLHDNPYIPTDIKNSLDKMTKPGNPLLIIAGIFLVPLMLIPMVTAIFKPLGNLITYAEDVWTRSYRFDPLTVMEIFKRDKTAYTRFRQDLREDGVSDDRITALEELSNYIPQAQDIIRFALREVYTPEIAEKYGQFQDIPTPAYVDAARAGLPKDTFDKFWAAHWFLPSSGEGFEMMHRGVITEDELKALLKANDIMPGWRDKLMAISWNVPTRVDVRRFWEMRTIDEARLREIYTAIGYHGKDLEDYVLWTKIYVDFPTLLARYKNGWITLEDVKRELIAMGMAPAQADIMIEEKIKKEAPERVAAEKELTKAEIIKGVKLAVITREEGVELLTGMGYDTDEANYILTINIEASTGSPHNIGDFRDLVEKYRAATGKGGVPIPEELKRAADELVRVTKDVEALREAVKLERAKLEEGEPLPAEATKELHSLQAKMYRAEAELVRVKNDYERQVAAWRYSA